jgi:hypothetical protein
MPNASHGSRRGIRSIAKGFRRLYGDGDEELQRRLQTSVGVFRFEMSPDELERIPNASEHDFATGTVERRASPFGSIQKRSSSNKALLWVYGRLARKLPINKRRVR